MSRLQKRLAQHLGRYLHAGFIVGDKVKITASLWHQDAPRRLIRANLKISPDNAIIWRSLRLFYETTK